MIDRLTEEISIPANLKPKYFVQRCPVCNGFGTVSNQKLTCHACNGKGFIKIPVEKERDKEYGE